MMRAHSEHWLREGGKPACERKTVAHGAGAKRFAATPQRFQCKACRYVFFKIVDSAAADTGAEHG